MTVRRLVLVAAALTALAACELFWVREDEGSWDSPVQIYVDTPYEGSVGRWGTSYYMFVPLDTGLHTIAVTETRSDLHWDLWDSDSALIASCQHVFVAGDEIETVSLESGQTYKLTVYEDDWKAGDFTITVTGP